MDVMYKKLLDIIFNKNKKYKRKFNKLKNSCKHEHDHVLIHKF